MVANVVEMQQSSNQIQYMEETFKAQKAAYATDRYPSREQRAADLSKLKSALLKHRQQLAEALEADFTGRGALENYIADIFSSVASCDFNKGKLKKWMKPESRSTGLTGTPGSAKVMYQPLGVVGIIVPWNYPILLAASPLAAALAAGNRVMLKMSEFTPRTSEVFKQMIASVFPEDKVAVVTGEADVGAAFSSIPWDHLLFTGATSIGKHVMAAAAKNLTPVTLELGGKSPTIIGDDAPLKDTVEKIASGKLMNAGQTCLAPDYLLVKESRLDEFVTALKSTVAMMHSSIRDNKHYTAIISERQHKRLVDVIEDAKAKGAEVIAINPQNEDLNIFIIDYSECY